MCEKFLIVLEKILWMCKTWKQLHFFTAFYDKVEICTSAKKHDTYAKRSFFTRDETTQNGDEILSEVAFLLNDGAKWNHLPCLKIMTTFVNRLL